MIKLFEEWDHEILFKRIDSEEFENNDDSHEISKADLVRIKKIFPYLTFVQGTSVGDYALHMVNLNSHFHVYIMSQNPDKLPPMTPHPTEIPDKIILWRDTSNFYYVCVVQKRFARVIKDRLPKVDVRVVYNRWHGHKLKYFKCDWLDGLEELKSKLKNFVD